MIIQFSTTLRSERISSHPPKKLGTLFFRPLARRCGRWLGCISLGLLPEKNQQSFAASRIESESTRRGARWSSDWGRISDFTA